MIRAERIKDGKSMGFEALDLKITESKAGAIATFSVRYDTGMEFNDWINLYYYDSSNVESRVFAGAVRDIEHDINGELLQCTVNDIKKLVYEMSYGVRTKWATGGSSVTCAGAVLQAGIDGIIEANPNDITNALTLVTNSNVSGINITETSTESENCGALADKFLNAYTPAVSWRYDALTNTIVLYNVYTSTPTEIDAYDESGLPLFDNITPSMDGCYTRVVVEGENVKLKQYAQPTLSNASSVITLDANLSNHYNSLYSVTYQNWGRRAGSIQGTYEMYCAQTTITHSAIDFTTRQITPDVESINIYVYPCNINSPVPTNSPLQIGLNDRYYTVDDRSNYVAGPNDNDESAYSFNGYLRTLYIVDDSVGSSVFVRNNVKPKNPGTTYFISDPVNKEQKTQISALNNEGLDAFDLVDRSAYMSGMAESILQKTEKIKWIGNLTIKATPLQYNCATKIQLKNVPHYEDREVMCIPTSITFSASSNELQIQLGDDRYNPLDEIQINNAVRWAEESKNAKQPLAMSKTI